MLIVKNIRVRSFDLDYLDIFWDIEPTYEDLSDYSFYLLKGETEYGNEIDYPVLAGPFTDHYQARDTTIRGQLHKFRKWFYRIKVVNNKTSAFALFPEDRAVTNTAKLDLFGLEMARIERLRFSEFAGRLVWLFPIRTFGQFCTCVDRVTQQKKRERCVSCYDTKFIGGYLRPLQVPIQIITPDIGQNIVDFTELGNAQGYLRMGNAPEIYPRWVIVEQENVRWKIGEGIKRIQKGRATIKQEAPLHNISVGDIEYKLPINVADISGIEATPARNYNNPMNLEAATYTPPRILMSR